MEKYFGEFKNVDDVNMDFMPSSKKRWEPSKGYVVTGEPLVKDEEIVFAAYDGGGYDGWALVVFERDGKLWEVNGSHCSCFGLEDQWEPEETSWASLIKRKGQYYFEDIVNKFAPKENGNG